MALNNRGQSRSRHSVERDEEYMNGRRRTTSDSDDNYTREGRRIADHDVAALESGRRTAPSRDAQLRREELRYRSERVEADFADDDPNYDDDYEADYDDEYDADRNESYDDRYYDARSDQKNPRVSRGDNDARRGNGVRGDNDARRGNDVRGGNNTRGGSGSRTPRKKHRGLKALIILVLLVVIGYFGWGMLRKYMGAKYWTVAVFGVDSRDGNLAKGAQSDVIMVASINRRTGDVQLTSVYRDTYCKVSDDKYHKINEAYFLGGHEQAIQALERNFDLQIDDYVTFNWAAVAKGINVLGGVDLDISDSEFKYINAFITETVNSTGLGSVQLQPAGTNNLDGGQAVAYGRLRLIDTDFNRTARQRKILSLAFEKAKAASKKTLLGVVAEVMPEISTSLSAQDITELALSAKQYNIANTQGFPFARTTAKVGKMDVVVAGTIASNTVELHQYLYGEDAADYTPSQTVLEISAHVAEKTGVTKPLDNAPDVKIGGQGTATAAAAAETPAATKAQAAETKAPETAASVAETTESVSETETTAEETTETTKEAESETEKETTATKEETKTNTSDEGPGSEIFGGNTNGPTGNKSSITEETKKLPDAPSPETTATDAEPIGPGVESLT